MIDRSLYTTAFSSEFGRQMRFIAGPRQCGKTTLAKKKLEDSKCQKLYFNFDQREIRQKLKLDYNFYENEINNLISKPKDIWLCFDEIHKLPAWKNTLKGYFDKNEKLMNFMITGSARLDLFRKSGDSLAGRYFLFRLFPVSLRELYGKNLNISPENDALQFVKNRTDDPHYAQEMLEALLKFSGFPEPLLKGSEKFYRKWHNDYIDRLVKEDLRDLSKIVDLENVATLITILPTKIANPLSINSLTGDLGVSFTAAKNYLQALDLTYITFSIKPYSKRIARAVKKETKCYLYDYTGIQNMGARFENYTALELKILVESWNDSGEGNFDLNYIRTKDGKETDFLITKDGDPWLLLEAKFGSTAISPHHEKQRKMLGNIPFVQIVHENKIMKNPGHGVYIVSASRFFR